MGYLQPALEAVDKLVYKHGVKTVAELGDQMNFTREPAPYMSGWFRANGVEYMSIDLNGLNESKQWDMSEPLKTSKKYDLVTDVGFSEHVKDLYQCFANIDKLTKVGGYMLHENPRTKNWPNHCYHYFDEKFYVDLAIQTGYHIMELKNTVAAHNHTSGNNVFCLMRKTREGFIEREEFPKTYTE